MKKTDQSVKSAKSDLIVRSDQMTNSVYVFGMLIYRSHRYDYNIIYRYSSIVWMADGRKSGAPIHVLGVQKKARFQYLHRHDNIPIINGIVNNLYERGADDYTTYGVNFREVDGKNFNKL